VLDRTHPTRRRTRVLGEPASRSDFRGLAFSRDGAIWTIVIARITAARTVLFAGTAPPHDRLAFIGKVLRGRVSLPGHEHERCFRKSETGGPGDNTQALS